MLIYNEQKDFVNRRNEETYGMLIPEDNFWRQLNKHIDFSSVYGCLEEYTKAENKTKTDIIRTFKCLLLKSYYNLAVYEVVEKAKTELTFRYFLECEPGEMDVLTEEDLKTFSQTKLRTGKLLEWTFDITKELAKKKNVTCDSLVLACDDSEVTIGEVADIFIANMKQVIKLK